MSYLEVIKLTIQNVNLCMTKDNKRTSDEKCYISFPLMVFIKFMQLTSSTHWKWKMIYNDNGSALYF